RVGGSGGPISGPPSQKIRRRHDRRAGRGGAQGCPRPRARDQRGRPRPGLRGGRPGRPGPRDDDDDLARLPARRVLDGRGRGGDPAERPRRHGRHGGAGLGPAVAARHGVGGGPGEARLVVVSAPRPVRPGRGARVPLLLPGMLALLAALWGGLLRLGWQLPAPPTPVAAFHGPLMVAGVLGTVIGMERAVALGRAWAYLAPLASGLGALALLAGSPAGS